MSVGAAYQPQSGDIALLVDGHSITLPLDAAAALQAYLPDAVAWALGVAIAIGHDRHPIQIEASEERLRHRPDERIARKVEETQARRASELVEMRAGPVRKPRDPALPIGAYLQLTQIEDGPGAARASLRECWPETHELLGRMAAQLGERPLPLLVRLINDEAARHGLRRSGEE